jgi:hypothetical protein
MRSSDRGGPTACRNSSVCHRLPDVNTPVSHRIDRGPTLPISKEGVSAVWLKPCARRYDDPHVALPGGDNSRYRKDGPMKPRHGTTWVSAQRLIAGRMAKEDFARPKGSAPFSCADHHACVRADQMKHGPVVSAERNLPTSVITIRRAAHTVVRSGTEGRTALMACPETWPCMSTRR